MHNFSDTVARRTPARRLDLNAILGISTPSSEVMLNKAGLTNTMELLRHEAMVTSITIPHALARLQNTRHWGIKQLRLAHRMIFEPIYDWAGEIRTVDIQKQGRRFADKDRIEFLVENAFRKFYSVHSQQRNLTDNLRRMSTQQISCAFANLYNDLNLVPPFREGNGRTIKTILTAMVRQADLIPIPDHNAAMM